MIGNYSQQGGADHASGVGIFGFYPACKGSLGMVEGKAGTQLDLCATRLFNVYREWVACVCVGGGGKEPQHGGDRRLEKRMDLTRMT